MTEIKTPPALDPKWHNDSDGLRGRGAHLHSTVRSTRLPRTLLSSLVIGLALGVLAWPSSTANLVNLDGVYGWQTALAMAAHSGMAFGTSIVFTYGPLGFLTVQQLDFWWTGALAFVFTLALATAVFGTLVWSLRRSVPLVPAVVVAYIVGAVSLHTEVGPEYVLGLVLVACVAVLSRPGEEPVPGWVWLILGGALSVFTLVKVSLSLGILAALIITAACLHGGRVRAILTVAVGAVSTFCLCWFVTGNGIGNLVPFARNSVAVIGGYSAAMSDEDPTRGAIYWFVPFVVALVGLFALASARGLPRRSKIGIGLVTPVILWVLFKEGFVRHDNAHDVIFFSVAPVALVAFVPRLRSWALVPGVLILTVITVIVAGGLPSLVTRPDVAVRNFADEVNILASRGKSDAFIQRSQRSLQASYALPSRMVAMMKGQTVDVSPWEQTVAWAYPDIRFDPLPVIADYSAYTPALDRLDAEYLTKSDAPRFILRQPESIDGRDPAFEPPATQLAIQCRYRQVAGDGFLWQLLERGPDRCGPPRHLSTVTTLSSHWVQVPAASPGNLVAASFQLSVGPWWTLQSFLFKPPNAFLETTDVGGSQGWRFIVSTGSDLHVLRAASTLGYYSGFVQPAPTKFRLSIAGQNPELRVSFYEVHEDAVAGGNGQINGRLTTSVRRPVEGTRLSGTTVLVAGAKDLVPVGGVSFDLTGGKQQDTTIGVARMTGAGWLTTWDTAHVANGAYMLQSVAWDDAGRTSRSAAVRIIVDNR